MPGSKSVFVIGVTGGIGSRLAAKLIGRGDRAISLHRRPEQAPLLRARGIEPVAGEVIGDASEIQFLQDRLGSSLSANPVAILTSFQRRASPKRGCCAETSKATGWTIQTRFA